MSGVEAVFGVAAGGIGITSLSIQLAESAIKLRKVYKTVKNAPKRYERLSEDLEIISQAMASFGNCADDNQHSALLAQAISRCQRDINNVQSRVTQLLARYERKRGKLQVALADSDLDGMLEDLERSKSSLHIACMMYRNEEQEQRQRILLAVLASHGAKTDIILAQISPQSFANARPSAHATVHPDPDSPTAAKSRCVPYDRRRRFREKKSIMRARLQLPSWLCGRYWDVTLQYSCNSWGMSVTTYNAVPKDALIFLYCQAGNLEGMRMLLSTGRASHLDIQGDGDTLLERAVYHSQVKICQFLLSETALPDQSAVLTRALRFWTTSVSPTNKEEESAEINRLLSCDQDFDCDVLDEGQSKMLSRVPWGGDSVGFPISQLWQLDGLLLSDRITVAMLYPNLSWQNFLRMAGTSHCDPELALWRDHRGKTILHHIAEHLFGSDAEQWMKLGASVVENGLNPCSVWHRVDHLRPATAFTILLEQSIERGSPMHKTRGDPLESMGCIRSWAELLRNAGCDLMRLGEVEVETWQQLGLKEDADLTAGLSEHEEETLRALDLIYGPDPSDWDVKLVTVTRRRLYAVNHAPGA